MTLSITGYCRITPERCIYNGEELLARNGEENLKSFLASLYRALQVEYLKFFKMDNLSKAGFLAAELLLQKLTPEEKEGLSLFVGNRAASLDTDIHFQETIGETWFPSPSLFVYTLPNIVLGEIAIRHKIYGENTFWIAPEWDPATCHANLLQLCEPGGNGKFLTGWAECLGEACDIFLMLLEKEEGNMAFTPENIRKLYAAEQNK